MELALFSPPWWSALAAIIVIDLVLAGDNAIVIGLAARNVPKEMQRRVVLWGTFGAIAVRVLLTTVVVWLLMIPGFLVVGGLALLYIGWKLTQANGGSGDHAIEAKASVASAIRTIVIADAVMGVDNVLAVGGAAHGSVLLVVIGLAISIPIVIWGSTLVLRWVERFPQIMWLGAAVLGWTAAKMVVSEPLLAGVVGRYPELNTLAYVIAVGGLVAFPVLRSMAPAMRAQAVLLAFIAAWVTVWGWIEDRFAFASDPIDDWHWDNGIVDLVRWVGWIPIALVLYRKLARRARPQDSNAR